MDSQCSRCCGTVGLEGFWAGGLQAAVVTTGSEGWHTSGVGGQQDDRLYGA